MESFRIGDVARLTGASISTLRLWEQHGLITPHRTDRGQRLYSPEQLQKAHMIVRMRKVEGLNMSAIKRVQAQDVAVKSTEMSSRGSESVVRQEEYGPTLATRFRTARAKAGLSLREVSDLSGLPMSFISTFERTNRGATVASLQRLAECYNTTVTELSTGGPRPKENAAEVVLSGKEEVAPHFQPGIKILQLASTLESLDCQKWVLAPGARSEGAYSHAGEEFIHVLRGEFIISVDGGPPQSLRPGDSISFESRRPHIWLAGELETEVLWVNTPKSY